MQIKVKNDLLNLESTGEIFAAILKSRGLTDKEEMEAFLRPPALTLAYLLGHISVDPKQLASAKKIILQAINDGEDICVFGDYDADGITSTAILWQSLMLLTKASKARVMPFIPDRTRHGYGLSTKAAADILDGTAFAATTHPDFHPSLIVTVDNGIVALSCKRAPERGLRHHYRPSSTWYQIPD
jgi:single-stranded-DNA-specific exonuclease